MTGIGLLQIPYFVGVLNLILGFGLDASLCGMASIGISPQSSKRA
jgi:hypothetical protein